MRQLCRTCKISLLCLPVGPEKLADECFICSRCDETWFEPEFHMEFLLGHDFCEHFEKCVRDAARLQRGDYITCDRCATPAELAHYAFRAE